MGDRDGRWIFRRCLVEIVKRLRIFIWIHVYSVTLRTVTNDWKRKLLHAGSNSLQNMLPVALRKSLESEKTLQSELSVFRIVHPNAGARCVGCYGRTPQDLSLSGGILATYDSVAQLCGDRDEIEGRASGRHCDARDGHGIQGGEVMIAAFAVVELKGRYSLRDDVNLWVSLAGENPVLSEHQEDEGWAMEKAHVRLSNTIDFAANDERDGETRRYNGGALVEV